jgi:drug/metabolite transporter (DMT)-like permease
MEPTMHAIPPPADGGEGGADTDAELARHVVGERVLVGRRVEVVPSRRPESRQRMEAARGLARLLPLAGMGLLLGGFVAFLLGVLTLGLGAPEYTPLFGFGITLMLLAAASIAAGSVLARRGRPRLGRATRMLITLAVVFVAVATATAVAGVLEGWSEARGFR